MKRLLIAALAGALLFPLAAQEDIWDMAVRKAPVEQIEELVRAAEMSAPPESEEPWLFSVVSDSEQVSSIVQHITGNTSAVVVSLPAQDYDGDSDLAFRSGMAVERLMEIARREPQLVAQLIAPPADLSGDLKEELGIPSEHKAIAVVVLAERPRPMDRPDRRMGMDAPSGFEGRRRGGHSDGFRPPRDDSSL